MTKTKAAAWLICFALFLLVPTAVYPLVKPMLNTENTENRQLAEKPSLGMDSFQAWRDGHLTFEESFLEVKSSLKAYPSLYNSYYNDHLPFRSELIEKNSLINMKVFGDSSSESVVLGKDNWLFFTNEESIEDYKGTNLYTEEEMNIILDNVLATKNYLEAKGIEYVLFIPSNKEDIYSEYLPDYIEKKGELTRAQQVVNCLTEAGVRVVYPREALKQYSEQYDLYWHYDTHWNNLGGYIGARELLAELGVEVPAPEELSIIQSDFSGYDLAGMLNLKNYYQEKMPSDINYDVYGYPFNNMSVINVQDATELVYQSEAPDQRRFFMVRDSFGGATAPVISSSFGYTYMPHWNGYFQQSMIDEQQPDIFVYEVVERRLDILLTFRME